MEIVEEVAFRRMDVRIVGLILERGLASDLVHITHQEVAAELGSSREVVSRILEDFSAQGMIAVSRGNIKILDREALQAYSVV
jgi:CRP/FNR family transcriptional regulator